MSWVNMGVGKYLRERKWTQEDFRVTNGGGISNGGSILSPKLLVFRYDDYTAILKLAKLFPIVMYGEPKIYIYIRYICIQKIYCVIIIYMIYQLKGIGHCA